MTTSLVRSSSAAAVLLALLVLGSSAAEAYTTLDGNRARFNEQPSYTINNSSTTVSGTADEEAIRAAFATWEDVAGINLTFTEVGSNASIDVWWENDWPAEFGDTAAGVTITNRTSTNISGATIYFNEDNFTWSTDGAGGMDADIQGVATHEIGHAIGLDHSFQREATMYWSGADVPLRDLEVDDENGLRFLYGETGLGVTCDQCQVDADCAGDGTCVNYGAERFCGDPCNGPDDCGENTACFNINGGGTACAPEADPPFCRDNGGSNLSIGDYCWGSTQCSGTLQCVPFPEGPAQCTRECDDDTDCPGQSLCVGNEDGPGICLLGGDGEFGDQCESNLDCGSIFCLPFDTDYNVCSQECDPDANTCPGDATCVALPDDPDIDGVCVPPGTLGEGQTCNTGPEARCENDLICILDGEGDDAPGTCRDACDPFGTCGNGFNCTAFSAADWYCLPNGDAGEGELCNNVTCSGDTVCIPLDDTDSACFRPCDPTVDGFCGADVGCFDLELEEGDLGVCSYGELGFEDSCEAGLDCASFACISLSDDEAICTQECDGDCPDGYMCAESQGGGSLCFVDEEAGNNTGANNTGANNTGANNTGENNTMGGNNTGENNTGANNTGENNTMGGNNGGENNAMGGNNTGGNNGGGANNADNNDDEEDEGGGGRRSSGCSTTPGAPAPGSGLALILLLGAVIVLPRLRRR